MQAIEVGQVWETRGGGRVAIKHVNRPGPQPICGIITAADGKVLPCEYWHTNGRYFRDSCEGECSSDLIRLISPAPIDLTEQTINTFARIVRNGGKVPDGYKLERNHKSNGPDRGWLCIDEKGEWSNLLNYRLTPIPQPPRFSVSTDPIGVLDSQQPGMVAEFSNLASASEVCKQSNANHDSSRTWLWTPIAPEIVPLEMADVPPGSVFSSKPDIGWFNADINTIGIEFGGCVKTWAEVKDQGFYILRPGQTEWQKCEKPKP